MDGVLAKLKTDAPNNNAVAPPWESSSAKFTYTKLPRAKGNCTIAELRAAATTAINEAENETAQSTTPTVPLTQTATPQVLRYTQIITLAVGEL